MSPSNGTILDATAIIDFHWLDEWAWLARHYGPLFVSTELLSSDALEDGERGAAGEHLASLPLTTGETFTTLARLRAEQPGMSLADRATIALAIERSLRCATDDDLLVAVCRKEGVDPVRTLAMLRRMVETRHKTAREVILLADDLIKDRGKWISPKVLRAWQASVKGD